MSTLHRSLIVSALAASALLAAAENYTYVDLVNRLIDLEGLAALPGPSDRCAQFSSYDRASRYDVTSGKYVNWDANGDGGCFIRRESNHVVLAEMNGPGCIRRIWSAAPGNGHVRIYLDGATNPIVDLPFTGYFDVKNPPFTYSSLVFTVAGGGVNCYVPIPYQKSCKITADPGWGNYYHFTYETFSKSSVVPTFSTSLPPEGKQALAQVDTFLRTKLGTDPAGERVGARTVAKTVTVPAGKRTTIIELKGPRAITSFKVKTDFPSREQACSALREIAVAIYWDGEEQPAVWAPLGDFFGTTPGINKYKSLPLGMTDEGFYSFWYMPFSSAARVELCNDGPRPCKLDVAITHAPLTRGSKELGRFHAKWHRDTCLPREPARRRIDWTILKTEGRGRFCGVMLHVWNPRGGWWGEGDEKFFIDGEKFPSIFGTGSEDYFGYAWCCPELFSTPFVNQTHNRGNKGHVSVNRWQIADAVPFHTSFEGCIEKYFPNKRPTLYACVAYWYLSRDGADPYNRVPLGKRTEYYVVPNEPEESDYITSWLALGSFPNPRGVSVTGYTIDYIGEAAMRPAPGMKTAGRTWKELSSSSRDVCLRDFGWPSNDFVVAYAHAYVYSPRKQEVVLYTGSDDGCRTWLNGVEVSNSGDVSRGFTADTETTDVLLEKGWNSLLMKVTQQMGDWRFSAAFHKRRSKGITFSCTPGARPDTQ